jgi:hypothetical protein
MRSAEVLDRFQENKLRGLEELLASWSEMAEQLASWTAAAATGGGQDQAAAVADFLVDEGIGLRQSCRHFWDIYWAEALAGQIPDRKERGETLRSRLERASQTLARGAAIARTCADLSGYRVARLSQFEQQAREFPLWVAECMARWDMLDRPRKPLNRERIAQSQAAYQRGEGEPVAEVIARLKQGGPLVKE